MIKRIVLKNYRVYDDLDMSFEELQIIKGRNGTGKTTIVEAIGFALFGSALQRGKANEWIKEGHKDGGVVLYIDNHIIKRSNTLAVVEDLDGNVVARNRTGIVEWVEREYGLTAELYRTSFYIGQKDIGAFAALAPLERTKRVEKLLRIDRLDVIKTQAKDKAKEVNNNLALYVSKLEASPFDINILNDNIIIEEEGKQQLSKLNEEYETLLVKSGEYKQAIVTWRTKQALLLKFTGEVEDLEQLELDYKAMLERNANVDSYNRIVREKVTLVRNLAGVLVLEKYFNSDIKHAMAQEISLKAFNKAQIELGKLDCVPKAHDLNKLRLEISAKDKIFDLNKNIPEDCPTCKQPWPTKATVDISMLLEEIQAMEAELSQQQREQRAHELTVGNIKPDMTQQEIDETISSVTNKDKWLRLQELDGYDELKKIEGFHTDMPGAREQKQIADRLKEMEDVTEPEAVDLEPLRFRIKELKSNMTLAADLIKRESGYQAVQEEFSSLRNEADEHLEGLKQFIKFIDQYRKAFGANVIPLLEENVSSIVSYLSEGKYDKIKINNDYGIDNFEFYSGSEQDSINFALRLAIAQVSKLGNFNTMLLDEIAASFDDQKEQLLMDILKQQSTQLIYITHGEL